MFIDVDYKRRIVGTKIYLAKPNKQIISHIFESFNRNISIKLGDINEMSFSIPYYIEDDDGEKLIYNKHIDMIKEKMFLKVTMEGYEEWYVVEDIDEEGKEDNIFTVTAYSIGYELRGKRISGLEEDSINAEELLEKILEGTLWKIGEINANFKNMYRSFSSGDDSNALNCIVEMAETFGALLIWNTVQRKISLKIPKDEGRFRGLTVDYGKLLTSIKRTRTPTELVTRLYVRGNEDLSIQRVNPTGEDYIEDFSYFMYPFQRSGRRVIRSSYFMSDELCHALLDHEELINSNSSAIKNLVIQREDKQSELVVAESNLFEAEMELENILELLDIAKSAEDQLSIDRLNLDRLDKESQILSLKQIENSIKSELSLINNSLESLYDSISNQANFTNELKDELKLYINEYTWKDDNYIDDEELYADGLKKFEELRKPKVVVEATIANFLNAIEEQHNWDKLILGDLIKVKYPHMKIEYIAKIIEMNFDIDNDEVELVIANTEDLLSDQEKLIQLLYSNKTATTLVENNKYKWDKINAVEQKVHEIITQEWDATKNKIIAGVRNSIQIGSRGIIIENPDFPNEVVIMQSGVIALSKDKGETWKTAITPSGIVAERLIGQIIAGQELIITNSAGTFTMDSNGFEVYANSFRVRSSSGDKNLVDEWNKTGDFVTDFLDDGMITPFEKEQLKIEWTKIRLHHEYLSEIFIAYFDNANSMADFIEFESLFSALFDYLHTENQTDGFPLLSNSNIDKTTRILKETFDERFNNYRNKVPVIEKLLSMRSKELAQEAILIAQKAKDDIEDIMNDIVYKVELTSTNGIVFKNNNIETTIYARVFRGNDDITSTLPNSSFIWKKYDKDGVLDTQWVNAHMNVGSTIEVNRDDVFQKATFSCDIDIPD